MLHKRRRREGVGIAVDAVGGEGGNVALNAISCLDVMKEGVASS